MTPDVKAAIRRTSVASAVIGAVLSPIPLVDELVLMPVYLGMAARIAKLHDLRGKGRAVPWRPIAWTTVNGLLARAAANVAVSYIPGVAAVANAASAALLTGLLGDYVDEACADPENARPIGVKALVERLRGALGAATASPTA
jgi:uncharacterized protein (DUF697 family)